MHLEVEVTDDGLLKVNSAEYPKGAKFTLSKEENVLNSDKGKWEDLEKVFQEFDALDFPRRTYEEIIRDLHDLRG